MIEFSTFNSPRGAGKNILLDEKKSFKKKFFSDVSLTRRLQFKYELLTPPELGDTTLETRNGDSTEGVVVGLPKHELISESRARTGFCDRDDESDKPGAVLPLDLHVKKTLRVLL